jgi:alkaline phosphatase D
MRHALAILATLSTATALIASDGPFQATGFKVGEVTDTSAIVWMRLTLHENRNPVDAPMVKIELVGKESGNKGKNKRRKLQKVVYPDGSNVATIRNAVPGAKGQTRVLYSLQGSGEWKETAWGDVDDVRDFTRQVTLLGLAPNARYAMRVEARASADASTSHALDGGFRTAPSASEAARVVFTVSTGQAFKDQDFAGGFKIYGEMLKLDPSFFVHTGDIVYYDNLAKTEALARYHWQRTFGLPSNVEFHRRVSSYLLKDDHDVWQNDCWPTMAKGKDMGEFTFAHGLAIFREQVPMGETTYRTRRWGKDLQIWMVEGRDFRSANTDKDGPEKTIWGKEQLEWFRRTVTESDATFRVLISPTPVVGPDRAGKKDNHSNANFAYEGKRLREFLSKQKNMVVICGDRHWQYMSVDPTVGLREYSCGPASDSHAGGWKKSDFRKDYHHYLNVIGGFLSVTIERASGKPTAIFRYHDVRGRVGFESRVVGD